MYGLLSIGYGLKGDGLMIPVFKTKMYTKDIVFDIGKVLDSGIVGAGDVVKEFERQVADRIGTRFFVATNNGTNALQIALRVLFLERGANVLTSPITFSGANMAIVNEGLCPVFCDVCPTTGNMNPDCIKQALEEYDIQAILVTHIGGWSADMEKINVIARESCIPVIEDCAHAFGGRYKNGDAIGNTNNICAWSFGPTKCLTCAAGGGISSNDHMVAIQGEKLRDCYVCRPNVWYNTNKVNGTKPWNCEVDHPGFRFHFNNVLASIGLVQLKHLDEDLSRRKEIAAYYAQHLLGIVPFYMSSPLDALSSYHFLPMFFENRDALHEYLNEHGVASTVHYPCNFHLNLFSEYPRVNGCQKALWYSSHELTLPFHLYLTDDDLSMIVDLVKKFRTMD